MYFIWEKLQCRSDNLYQRYIVKWDVLKQQIFLKNFQNKENNHETKSKTFAQNN